MQPKCQAGYYVEEIAGKRRKLFEALGVRLQDSEPEREMNYEDKTSEDEGEESRSRLWDGALP